jgi:hypothetical protein
MVSHVALPLIKESTSQQKKKSLAISTYFKIHSFSHAFHNPEAASLIGMVESPFQILDTA